MIATTCNCPICLESIELNENSVSDHLIEKHKVDYREAANEAVDIVRHARNESLTDWASLY